MSAQTDRDQESRREFAPVRSEREAETTLLNGHDAQEEEPAAPAESEEAPSPTPIPRTSPFWSLGPEFRQWLLLTVGLFFGFAAYAYAAGAMRFNIVLDDTYISLRYAQHLWEGHGPVWNVGEKPVEGYTNFLWMVIAAGHFAFTEFPEVFLLWYNRLFGLLIIAAVWWELLRRGQAGRYWAWLGVGLVAFAPNLHHWMMGGLETHFFGFLLIVAVGRFLREEFTPEAARLPLSCIPMALALLTRPEAYMVGLVLGGTLVLRRVLRQRVLPRIVTPGRWNGWGRVLAWGGVCAVVGGTHLLWRYSYYDAWLPNTFTAKVPGAYFKQGIPYVQTYLWVTYLSWVIPALAGLISVAAGVFFYRHPLSGQTLVLSVIVGLYWLYVMYAGGDIFEFRILAPTIGLVALWLPMVCELLRQSVPARTPGARGAATVVLALLGALILGRMTLTTWRPEHRPQLGQLNNIPMATDYQGWDWAEQWRPTGEWLRAFAEPDTLIGVTGAGVVPYVSGLPAYDVHGLNTREVALKKVERRGGVGHERQATEEEMAAAGVDYFMAGMSPMTDPYQTWPDWVRADDKVAIARLISRPGEGERWMMFRIMTGNPTEVRHKLRGRGAILLPGPHENAEEVNALNEQNRWRYEELGRRLADDRPQFPK